MASISLCLPTGPNEPPCSTVLSHLNAEHICLRGILQFLDKDGMDALANTCIEASNEVASFRWNTFMKRLREKKKEKESKEDYWTSLILQKYSHVPILQIISVAEIEPYNVVIEGSKEYILEIMAEDWIVPERKPLRVYFNFIFTMGEILCDINTYNSRRKSKIKEYLIDNREAQVLTYEEVKLKEKRDKALRKNQTCQNKIDS